MLSIVEEEMDERLGPQKGPQEAFLTTSADIAIYGGAAGGGKTFGLLLEPCRHIENKDFGGVIFRRQAIQVKSQGGLYDTSFEIYPYLDGVPKLSPYPSWYFPSGANLSFNHLTTDSDLLSWQGSQIPFIGFDELTHFSERQFFYMLSRNRSISSIKPYIRATTNPDVDSWVAKLIEWWIDQDTGFAIPERSGVIRWFIRIDDKLIWADTRQELVYKYPTLPPKSITFIPSKLTDNKILIENDPGYLANLMLLPRVDRERLLNGNWKVRWESGSYFPRAKVQIIDAIPSDVKQWVRKWDLAATVSSELNPSPDATAGILMGKRENGRFVIADGINIRENANVVREIIKNIASQDRARNIGTQIIIPQDPGQAGKDQSASLILYLAGYKAKAIRESGPKHVRAEPLSSQWCAGNIDIVAGSWNTDYLTEMENFPEADHDDYVDASSGAFLELSSKVSDFNRWTALAS
jgi:predicted phage terminase large subunit-like protein